MTDTPGAELLPFDQWLADLRDGQASYEWSARLAEVVETVMRVGKPGSLTITIDVEPKGNQLLIVDSLKAKLPEHDREAAIFFGDAVGGLHRRDPNQGRWETRDGELVMVDPLTGEVLRTRKGKK